MTVLPVYMAVCVIVGAAFIGWHVGSFFGALTYKLYRAYKTFVS